MVTNDVDPEITNPVLTGVLPDRLLGKTPKNSVTFTINRILFAFIAVLFPKNPILSIWIIGTPEVPLIYNPVLNV